MQVRGDRGFCNEGGIREGDFGVWLERHQPTETKGKDQKQFVLKSRLGLVRESTLAHLVIHCFTSEAQPHTHRAELHAGFYSGPSDS